MQPFVTTDHIEIYMLHLRLSDACYFFSRAHFVTGSVHITHRAFGARTVHWFNQESGNLTGAELESDQPICMPW